MGDLYFKLENRAKTFPGIAKAMAEQWGRYIEQEDGDV